MANDSRHAAAGTFQVHEADARKSTGSAFAMLGTSVVSVVCFASSFFGLICFWFCLIGSIWKATGMPSNTPAYVGWVIIRRWNELDPAKARDALGRRPRR